MKRAQIEDAVREAVSVIVAVAGSPIEDVRDPVVLRRLEIFTRMCSAPFVRMLDFRMRQGRTLHGGAFDGRRDSSLGRCAAWVAEDGIPLVMLLRAATWLPTAANDVVVH